MPPLAPIGSLKLTKLSVANLISLLERDRQIVWPPNVLDNSKGFLSARSHKLPNTSTQQLLLLDLFIVLAILYFIPF